MAQIYIPINYEELRWYTVVLNIPHRCTEIWDPLQSSSREKSLYEETKTMVIADFVVAMLRFNNSKKVLVNLDFCWVFDLRQMRALDEVL